MFVHISTYKIPFVLGNKIAIFSSTLKVFLQLKLNLHIPVMSFTLVKTVAFDYDVINSIYELWKLNYVNVSMRNTQVKFLETFYHRLLQ